MPNGTAFRRFGDVFDLARLRAETGVGVIEWEDLRRSASDVREYLGCWASLEAAFELQPSAGRATWEWPPDPVKDDLAFRRHLGVDVVRWPLPSWLRASTSNYIPFELVVAFDADHELQRDWTAALLDGSVNVTRQMPPTALRTKVRPSYELLCLDDAFYYQSAPFRASRFVEAPLPSNGPHDIYGPLGYGIADPAAWLGIGQHLHWTHAIDRAADAMLNHFGAAAAFIGLHVRAGDTFERRKGIEAWDERLALVRRRLSAQKGGRSRGKTAQLGVVVRARLT